MAKDPEETCLDKVQKDLFKSIFDESSEKMIVTGIDGKVCLANKSALDLLGYKPQDIIGAGISNLMLEKDREEFKNLLETVAKAGIVRNYKFYLLTSKKSIIRLFLTGVALGGGNGGVSGCCIYLALANTDEWAALKDPQFFQSVAKKIGRLTSIGQLTSVFAHDIKNPLHVILSTSELLLSSGVLDENLKTNMALIERNAQRASKIVKTLLDFSRSGICQLRPCCLNDISDYCLSLLESSLKSAKVKLTKELGTVPKVFLDPHYLHSVVYNLLTNAMESMAGREGEITLRTLWVADKKTARLIISDNGRGMDRNMRANLFHPFFTTKDTGTGLGLYLARQIMNEHSGEISVESEPGKGARVELVFHKIA
ncbi:MAG: PAS domain-containing sensor histidine kinase [Elusimicrobia bacterium]|nr:PAS domain-containing sensor histidine kinase [Elusimicrobiota bacterium]